MESLARLFFGEGQASTWFCFLGLISYVGCLLKVSWKCLEQQTCWNGFGRERDCGISKGRADVGSAWSCLGECSIFCLKACLYCRALPLQLWWQSSLVKTPHADRRVFCPPAWLQHLPIFCTSWSLYVGFTRGRSYSWRKGQDCLADWRWYKAALKSNATWSCRLPAQTGPHRFLLFWQKRVVRLDWKVKTASQLVLQSISILHPTSLLSLLGSAWAWSFLYCATVVVVASAENEA